MSNTAAAAAGDGGGPSFTIDVPHNSLEPDLIEPKQSPVPHSRPTSSPVTPPAAFATPTRTTPTIVIMDKTLAGAANLAQLLPSGTFLAFQALAPSFTNKGHCYTSNQCLTAALLLSCVVSTAFFTFTDSLVGRDGRLYYGMATADGICLFNFDGGEEERSKVFGEDVLRRRRRRWVDWLHAFLGVLVFLALAFSDADTQSCLFSGAAADAKELLVNLPLGAGVFASIVFMIFPTSRKGIGYSDPIQHSH
ncbi:hypothetical protein HPP92_010627 [Vanilla planifolia]|uniref:Uncharacterized protein n=1 Tax=Vanilla planifolia TaxID=51239 RepID=A0A835UXR1_VANPL|nr:hypothetical protein HPP92_010627 [Vanilla planifolia]